MNALRLCGLTKSYDGNRAVDDLTLTVHGGEIYGMLGPNGAGKTTTMRLVAGLARSTAGSIWVNGVEVSARRRRGVAAPVGVMLEEPAFAPHLSGRDNLRALAHRARVSVARVDQELARVRLSGRAQDRYDTYSMGMRQRLGLAAALLARPGVLVLDEPANGLDPAAMAGLRATLRGLAADGCAVLLSSHLLAETAQVCDRIGVMSRGRLVAETSMDELEGHGRLVICAEPLSEARDLIARHWGDDAVVVRDRHLEVAVPRTAAAEANRVLVAADIEVTRLEWRRPDLETLYLDLTGASDHVA